MIYSSRNQPKLFRIRKTTSNEFQCKNIVICQQQTPPLHTLPVSSIFVYLPMKDLVKHQRRTFLQQENAVNQDLFYPLIDKSTMSFVRNEMSCYLLKSPKTYAILGECSSQYSKFGKIKDETPQLCTFNELSRSSPVKSLDKN